MICWLIGFVGPTGAHLYFRGYRNTRHEPMWTTTAQDAAKYGSAEDAEAVRQAFFLQFCDVQQHEWRS